MNSLEFSNPELQHGFSESKVTQQIQEQEIQGKNPSRFDNQRASFSRKIMETKRHELDQSDENSSIPSPQPPDPFRVNQKRNKKSSRERFELDSIERDSMSGSPVGKKTPIDTMPQTSQNGYILIVIVVISKKT
jgi:hypothetical protein